MTKHLLKMTLQKVNPQNLNLLMVNPPISQVFAGAAQGGHAAHAASAGAGGPTTLVNYNKLAGFWFIYGD